ncbi:GDSL esterase/lipase At1g29670-like [Chenopodium quinoa]|uniref:GDSL esterase/lipase At1g29670-like n=1 Tax=Chenopodium quinoa TaxID=63459 RepID=UPI000B79863D|nr:GDSL esterase/lipase At1g29670-like [Chenopodium quinoa]XP_021742275.1 GDSL esterase/lipase At1g29670-like [Chenopodium quinoa]
MSLVALVSILVVSLQLNWVNGAPKVPCFFIFGDSLSDSGNNNNLITTAKCNFPPYGIDFPNGPTGRFTNGRTTVDLIGDHLGLPHYIKPFASIPEDEIMDGVNYASGSSGILDETGFQVGDRVCMNKQVNNHREVVSKIKNKLGSKNAGIHLNKCLYSIYVGSNDWMFNYFMRPTVMATHMIPGVYADELIKELTGQINTIISLGARKIILFGLSPLGCLPILNLVQTCSGFINGVLKDYNHKLKSLVYNYNSKHPGVKLVFINSMDIISANNLENLVRVGLKNTNQPCCGVAAECIPFSPPCSDRKARAYWDQEHPTEAANKILASRAYKAKMSTDTYPMDISALAAHH